VPQIASGLFTVTRVPAAVQSAPLQPDSVQPDSASPEVYGIGRTLLHKVWSGDLSGHSTVEMLSSLNTELGSGAYVALEGVTAVLQGRSGTFVFCHLGVQHGGHQTLDYRIVPDSAAGELVGLTGHLELVVEDGQHHYTLTYTLPDSLA
jgi:hypothetical protein